ncbi:hypothetical protein Drose_14815 [Dactylosporangium roseum]|uniref:Uncharacterized protein n=1 Tax=Dactylosporangium roseum TaxID=47989 RepID=A0ABY5ZC04_9ACTN|nr:hypothetical protein [Dactylosporangium roseum]UWZ39392.1 hypothetical protein Drose_14815 [Dactylosporangium roseum]
MRPLERYLPGAQSRAAPIVLAGVAYERGLGVHTPRPGCLSTWSWRTGPVRVAAVRADAKFVRTE